MKKHVLDIILPNIPYFDMCDLDGGENVLDFLPMYGHIKSHPLKFPKHEVKALHEIIITFITREVVIESLNQMLNPKGANMLSSQAVVRDVGKYVKTLGEDVASSDEGIF